MRLLFTLIYLNRDVALNKAYLLGEEIRRRANGKAPAEGQQIFWCKSQQSAQIKKNAGNSCATPDAPRALAEAPG